ncbi:MAG TPA: hypothetical protein DD379_12525 [Cyanobacteria bacterium UBA11162]|nr:hypothetical protein [Cyanobacteria bacterium UBA11162]
MQFKTNDTRSFIKSYVFDRINRRNNIKLISSNKDKSYTLPVLGILEIDKSEAPSLISRLELSSTEISPETNKYGNLFIRLSKFVAPVKYQNRKLVAEIEIVLGFLQSNANFEYLTFVTSARFEAKFSGNILVGSLSGSLPKDMPIVGGGEMQLDLLGICDSYGEFSAKFTRDGKPYPVRLQISNGLDCLELSGVTEVSELVPSHATYTLDWSVTDGDTCSAVSETRHVRDVISDVVIGPGSRADLEFSLFDPGSMHLLDPVILAQEPGTNASICNEFKGKPTLGQRVTLVTRIEGTPNRYVLLDTIGAAQNLSTSEGSLQGGVFVAPDQPTAIPICCNLKPPGPNSPGSEPVLRNPPGGSGGVPEEPSGGSGQPNSSTSDGGNSCDVNYSVVIPPSGQLIFETQAYALKPDEREIAFAGAFRNGARIPTANIRLLGQNGYCIERPLMPIWVVEPGYYELSVEIPAERTLRRIMELKFPVNATRKCVSQITAYPPTISEIQNLVPTVIGSGQQGIGFFLLGYSIFPGSIEIHFANESGGWVLVPTLRHCSIVTVVAETKDGADISQDCQYCSSQTDQDISLNVFWIPPEVLKVVLMTN